MKVLDLACSLDHVFEAWFGSEDDYNEQLARGLISCPLCGDPQVHKKLSAPRLNLGHAPAQATPAPEAAPVPDPQALQQGWAGWVRQVLARTEDVGTRFPEEVRRMHHGEAPERAIRGRATPAQCQALTDEGIEVFPLPLPDGENEPRH